ncbi:MAG: hypothetical protein GDA40_10090 [Rhodobacteraceae bacterium]|nr:hypothetical protein [Paracoccaceae bacterium]
MTRVTGTTNTTDTSYTPDPVRLQGSLPRRAGYTSQAAMRVAKQRQGSIEQPAQQVRRTKTKIMGRARVGRLRPWLWAACLILAPLAGAFGQGLQTPAPKSSGGSIGHIGQGAVGPETGFPLPRFVSLKNAETNLRRGPDFDYRIVWVFQRQHLPVRVIAEHGQWREIQDQTGETGWVYHALLSGLRTVVVATEPTENRTARGDLPLYLRPDLASAPVARLQAGVIAQLEECVPRWCFLRVGAHRGWGQSAFLWGLTAAERGD